MSGIFGINTFQAHKVAAESIERIADSLAHRSPDGIHIWRQDSIGLGHCMLHTTPESLDEHLPYCDQESGLAITADARLDNRDELGEKLGITKHSLKKMADSQVILAAYKKWGVDSFIQLLGDFAFAIWDIHNQRLLCVRDSIGIKPFYYRKSDRYFTFCSEIRPLAELKSPFPQINEGMVAEYLSFQFASRNETLFKDIFRLPPAHYLIVEKDKFSIHRYWDLPTGKRILYKTDEEYGEHFLDLFQQSVSCRMRSHLPVSAELSGGIDSSSIVSAACSLNRESHQSSLTPYALIFPGLPCDEKEHIDSVEEKWKLDVTHVPAHHFQPPDWQKQVLKSFHLPDMPNLSICDKLVQMVQLSGSKVILSGIGGDEWFSGCGLSFGGLLAHHRFSDIFREFRFQGGHGKKALLKRLTRLLLWPVIPIALRTRMCKGHTGHTFPAWLPEAFISKTHLLDRIAATDARIHSNSLIDAFYYKFILSDQQGFFLETLDRHRALAGVENRYPFLDRRLIEFAAALPEYQKSYRGQSKRIIRQGLNNLLPKEVRSRNDKAEFSYFFGQTFLTSEFEQNIKELDIANNGWIVRDIALNSYREAQVFFTNNPTKSYNKIWPIWFAFATDLWYKCLYNR